MSGTFELLDQALTVPLVQKTLGLLLLASGRRIGEMANIQSFKRIDDGVSLVWLPEFMAKHESSEFVPDHPFILEMDSSESLS